jgi:hypothetical protein
VTPKHTSKAPRTEPFSVLMPAAVRAKRIRRGTYRLDEDGMLEKRCPRCGEYWPADTEFFYAHADELSSYCRSCNHEHSTRHDPPPQPRAVAPWPAHPEHR